MWRGVLRTLDEGLEPTQETSYYEAISITENGLHVTTEGSAFDPEKRSFALRVKDSLAWVPAEEALEVAGSYSLSGGRALSGGFHHLEKALRVWRREVVSHDGTLKAVLHTWYRGGARVGVQFGVLKFEGAP